MDSHSASSTPALAPKTRRVRITGTFIAAKKFALAHKWWSGIALLILFGTSWYTYRALTSTAGETRYVLGTVSTTTIVSTVSASGQVSTSDEISITPKVSGEVTWVAAKVGDTVRAGQALFTIDNTDAKQAVVDAEQSLAEAKLQYQKDSTQAPIDYQKAQDTLGNAQDDLETEYNDTFNNLSTTYLDMPTVMTGINNTLYGYDLSINKSQWNVEAIPDLFTNEEDNQKLEAFAKIARAQYDTARIQYDGALNVYKFTTRSSSNDTLELLLSQSIQSTTDIAQSLQSTLNLLSTAIDLGKQHQVTIPASVTTMQTTVRNYLSTTNSDLSALLAQKKAIATGKQAVTTAEQNITLLKVGNQNGSDPISLQISRNNIASLETNLADLQDKLSDYTVVAPFAGTVTVLNAKRGSSISGAAATIVTNNRIAELSLNEVDAAKISLGDKATLTFDAIDGLTLTGTVSEIDPVGTVSQGVVSYTIKISFDSQDERIKPGMTVNASIITETRQDVLAVPSSAVKTANGQSYVLVFDSPVENTGGTTGVTSPVAPKQVFIETGISDDSNVEIVSGLTAGEQIVTRTISGSSLSSSSSSSKTGTSNRTTTTGGPAGGGAMLRL